MAATATFSKETHAELACTYAALLLQDAEQAISADKINKLLKASGNNIEAYWSTLFAKALESHDLGNLISGVGSSPAAVAPVVGTSQAPAAETKKEEKKEEKPAEEPADGMEGGIGLFGEEEW